MFVNATSGVEVNGPMGSILWAEYKQVISKLEKHQAKSSTFPILDKVIVVMIKWLKEYQDKAVNCEALVLATFLNPQFHENVSTLPYPEHKISSQLPIENVYTNILEKCEMLQPTTPPQDISNPENTDEFDVYGGSTGDKSKASISELMSIFKDNTPAKETKPLSLSGRFFLSNFVLLIYVWLR